MRLEVFLSLFHNIVLAAVLYAAVRLSAEKRSMRLVFFSFSAACYLFSDIYWLVYGLMRPESRMPFAANEICEWAMFLLAAASLNAKPLTEAVSARREMIGAALFTAANTALWIAWSGEWGQDLLTGVCFGYYLCCLTAHMKRDGVFAPWEWRLFSLGCIVLLAAQAGIFFVPEGIKAPLDLFCYALLFGGSAFLMVKTLLALKRGAPVCLSFAAMAWTTVTMYMSGGGFYLAAAVLGVLCFPLMLAALRKEAAA